MNTLEDKALEKKVQDCVVKYKHLQVYLTSGHGDETGESIWCTPCTEGDKVICEKGNVSDKFKVYLCNAPISWDGVGLRSQVVVTQNGDKRPYARLYDNEGTTYNEIVEEVVKEVPLRFQGS